MGEIVEMILLYAGGFIVGYCIGWANSERRGHQ
jgi:hypothetical protein